MTARATPWRDGDVVMVAALSVVGLAGIGVAWFGASGTADAAAQAGWLNLAVAGFVVAAVGDSLWLMRLRHAVGARRAALVSLDSGPEPQPVHRAARPGSTAGLALVRAAGMSHVHYPDCPLVAGKQLRAVTVGDGAPCGMCMEGTAA